MHLFRLVLRLRVCELWRSCDIPYLQDLLFLSLFCICEFSACSDLTMSEPAFLTTRTAHLNHHMPSETPPWTTRGDGFDLDLEEDEPPLSFIKHLAPDVDMSRCTETGEVVAVKRLRTYSSNHANEKLYNEVKILCDLKHYHCIRVLGSYTHDDTFNIVTQPIANCDLSEYLVYENSTKVEKMRQIHGPPSTFLPRIMGCLAYALRYIHMEPRVRHRDIKPENILLEGFRVLFADFGLSKVFTATQSGSSGPSKKTLMVRCLPSLPANYTNMV